MSNLKEMLERGRANLERMKTKRALDPVLSKIEKSIQAIKDEKHRETALECYKALPKDELWVHREENGLQNFVLAKLSDDLNLKFTIKATSDGNNFLEFSVKKERYSPKEDLENGSEDRKLLRELTYYTYTESNFNQERIPTLDVSNSKTIEFLHQKENKKETLETIMKTKFVSGDVIEIVSRRSMQFEGEPKKVKEQKMYYTGEVDAEGNRIARRESEKKYIESSEPQVSNISIPLSMVMCKMPEPIPKIPEQEQPIDTIESEPQDLQQEQPPKQEDEPILAESEPKVTENTESETIPETSEQEQSEEVKEEQPENQTEQTSPQEQEANTYHSILMAFHGDDFDF